MARKMISLFFGLVFILGLGLVLYPTFSNWYNQFHASRVISNYEQSVEEIEDLSAYKNMAQAHNSEILNCGSLSSAIQMENSDSLKTYNSLLNVADDGVMGVIRIPKIDVKLPIYHTSEDSVLQSGVGHYVGSSLPVGGKGTHCLLTGHRGLPSAKLFTNLDQLKKGDVFYLDVLDETLAYQVDSIRTVLPNVVESLDPEPESDYVTLITCTPYGVNTHRLLVRGSRIPYVPEEEEKEIQEQAKSKMHWILPIGFVLLIILLLILFKKRKSRNMGG